MPFPGFTKTRLPAARGSNCPQHDRFGSSNLRFFKLIELTPRDLRKLRLVPPNLDIRFDQFHLFQARSA